MQLLNSLIILGLAAQVLSSFDCRKGCRTCDIPKGSCSTCHFGFAKIENQTKEIKFNTCQLHYSLIVPVCLFILFAFGILAACLREKRTYERLEYRHCEMMREIHNSFRKDKIDDLTPLKVLPNTTIVVAKNSFSSLVTSSHLT